MGDESNDQDKWESFYRMALAGACGLILALTGALVGLWARSLDHRLDDLAESNRKQWQVLNERSSLAPRLSAVEGLGADQERRLREVEIRLGRR